MAITTVTGTGSPTTLVVSAAQSVSLTVNTTTDLLQSGAVSVTGEGHTVLFLARTASNNDDQCQVNILVDGVIVYTDIAGTQIIYRQVLTSGSHTIDFNVYALDSGITMSAAGLTVIDLGL